MKNIFVIMAFSIFLNQFFLMSESFATSSKKSEKIKNNEKSKSLKKEMHFSDQLVNGKFQIPGDNAVEVENEKPVFNLLQIRTDFNDRRLNETTRDE
jgi:hypothetical protein